MKTYIAYIRTSTRRQDLGLEAQQAIIDRFLRKDDRVLHTFIEQDSGSNNNRIELNKAMAMCKETKSILLIAKLDRLSRNVSFISTLLDDKDIDVCVADMPDANKLTLHILAAVAQQELDFIKQRTKDSLDVIKDNIIKNGFHISKSGNTITKLGNGKVISDDNRLLGVKAIKEKKALNPNNIKAKAFATSLRSAGETFKDIANTLNENGFKSANGGIFYPTSVRNLLL